MKSGEENQADRGETWRGEEGEERERERKR
jgi:hypothetical protein